MSELVEVADVEGTFTVYDVGGRCVGRVCTDTGRAMIGRAFWQRCDGGFVDRAKLLALAEELEKRAGSIVKAAREAQFSKRGPRMGEAEYESHEWRSIARSIREACGEAVS